MCVPGAQYKTMVTAMRYLPIRALSTVARKVRGTRRKAVRPEATAPDDAPDDVSAGDRAG